MSTLPFFPGLFFPVTRVKWKYNMFSFLLYFISYYFTFSSNQTVDDFFTISNSLNLQIHLSNSLSVYDQYQNLQNYFAKSKN